MCTWGCGYLAEVSILASAVSDRTELADQGAGLRQTDRQKERVRQPDTEDSQTTTQTVRPAEDRGGGQKGKLPYLVDGKMDRLKIRLTDRSNQPGKLNG